jgi:hypothetical protein
MPLSRSQLRAPKNAHGYTHQWRRAIHAIKIAGGPKISNSAPATNNDHQYNKRPARLGEVMLDSNSLGLWVAALSSINSFEGPAE